jgi:pimeloyl-ACP methyl ester carboxylesterase
MDTQTVEWSWRGQAIRLDVTKSGGGPMVLLLPALSSISTRREMRPLQERLARRYSTFCIDWPGFGDQARPPVDWVPDTYSAFLSFLLTSMVVQPHAIIAAAMRRATRSSRLSVHRKRRRGSPCSLRPGAGRCRPCWVGIGRFLTDCAVSSIVPASVRFGTGSTSTPLSCVVWAPAMFLSIPHS